MIQSELLVSHWEMLGLSGSQRIFKRGLDLVVASILLILLWPLMLLLAGLIWAEDGGAVLFRQWRVGERGRLFRMMKFRTMRPDAEQMQAATLKRDKEGAIFHKQADDPRVTQIGRFLRRTSLDELPQLLNVLLGDMSLVGPRPELPWIVAQYDPWQYRRLSVPQGMTGLWQVTGRSRNPMYLFTELDIRYVTDYSLWLDLIILLKTPLVVFRGDGAY
ncbi:MAG: sugar transferase [Candidatus Promineifilaceae bacterium]